MSYYDAYLQLQFREKLKEAEDIVLVLQNLTYDLETEAQTITPFASAFANYSLSNDTIYKIHFIKYSGGISAVSPN